MEREMASVEMSSEGYAVYLGLYLLRATKRKCGVSLASNPFPANGGVFCCDAGLGDLGRVGVSAALAVTGGRGCCLAGPFLQESRHTAWLWADGGASLGLFSIPSTHLYLAGARNVGKQAEEEMLSRDKGPCPPLL